MARIEGIRIQNYRALRDVTLGKTFERQKIKPLPKLMAIIGPNGCGKSSLMDALGFLGDCITSGVEVACDMPHRGGFERLRTRGIKDPIKFELYYRENSDSRPISYSLQIDVDRDGLPFVSHERLRQRRRGQSSGQPYSFLEITNGEGFVWAGEASSSEEGTRKIEFRLTDRQRLGITSYDNVAEQTRVVAFSTFLKGWYLSYFVPNRARDMPMAGAQKHLNREGDNLANYVQFLQRHHPKRFDDVLKRIALKIPGIESIKHEPQKDGRLLLQFNDRGYVDPFYQQDMSDGTLKMFAYLMLMEDPESAPFIGIEEPENGLHHQLLGPLAQEFRKYANQPGGPQVLVTTHSPYFVDELTPAEVWILDKGKDGFSSVERAADIPSIQSMYDEGIQLGSMWFSNHFGRGNP
jgi:predicted ATPase